MPINRKLMASLKRQYGPEKGERIYYAMEQKRGQPLRDAYRRRKKK